MQNEDIDQIEKTISECREAFFDAMLNRHYTHAALYMKCINACVPSELKLKLESIEAPEENLMSNENATDYAKRLCPNELFDSTLLLAIERKMAEMSFEFR